MIIAKFQTNSPTHAAGRVIWDTPIVAFFQVNNNKRAQKINQKCSLIIEQRLQLGL